jgi:ParB-like chromosome segregation protein Spo0J
MKSALLEQLTATDKKIEKLDLDTIQTKGLQTRAGTDPAKVAEYAEIYTAGGAMPPIVVFSDGGDEFYLADGHHRLAAARKAKLSEIEGLIKKGDRRDALWYATAANAQHGLARTNDDKRRAVALILADAEWRGLSDTAIADHASVSDRLVAKVRKELGAESATRKGKDGKTRTKPAAKPKAPAKESAKPQKTGPEAWTDEPTFDIGRHLLGWISGLDTGSDELANITGIPEARVIHILDTLVHHNLLARVADIGDPPLWELTEAGQVALHRDRHMTCACNREVDTFAQKHSEQALAQAKPPAGPEDLTVDTIAQPPKPSPEIPAPAAPAKPAPPQTLGDRVLLGERDLIAVELLKGKPQWTGLDNDLLALALIVGVPTRKQAWVDSVRANARHLFIDALRSEVADRVRNGEHTNRGWPVAPELCRLWGLDYQAIHLRAQHAAEK